MAKLTKNVAVDGVWYGPDWGDQDVPDDVAAKIEREDVWAGYVAPEVEAPVPRVQEPLRGVKLTGGYKTPEEPEVVPDPVAEPEPEPAVHTQSGGDAWQRVASDWHDADPDHEAFRDTSAINQIAVPSGSVTDVLTWVDHPTDGWQDRAEAALHLESLRTSPRKGIVDPLTELLTAPETPDAVD